MVTTTAARCHVAIFLLLVVISSVVGPKSELSIIENSVKYIPVNCIQCDVCSQSRVIFGGCVIRSVNSIRVPKTKTQDDDLKDLTSSDSVVVSFFCSSHNFQTRTSCLVNENHAEDKVVTKSKGIRQLSKNK